MVTFCTRYLRFLLKETNGQECTIVIGRRGVGMSNLVGSRAEPFFFWLPSPPKDPSVGFPRLFLDDDDDGPDVVDDSWNK